MGFEDRLKKAGGGSVTKGAKQGSAVNQAGWGFEALMNPQKSGLAGAVRGGYAGVPGIPEQISNAIEAAPAGAAHLATGVLTDPVAGAATGAMIASVIPGVGTLAGAGVGAAVGGAGWGLKKLLGSDDSPFETTGEFIESGGRTLNRLRHPTEYGKASRRGEIVGALLEDIANVSMVAHGAGKLVDVSTGGAASKVVQAERTLADAQAAVEHQGRLVEQAAKQARTPGLDPKMKALAESKYVGALEVQDYVRGRALAAGEALADIRSKVGPGTLKTYKGIRAVASMGDRGANLPAGVYTKSAEWLAHGLGKAAPKVAEVISKSDAGLAFVGALEKARDYVASREPVKVVRELIHQGEVRARAEMEPVLMLGAKFDKALPDPIDREAALAIGLQIPKLIKDVAENHGPEIVPDLVKAVTEDGTYFGISEEGLLRAVEFEQNRLPGGEAHYNALLQGIQLHREMMNILEEGKKNLRGYAPDEKVGEVGDQNRARARHQISGQNANPEAIAAVRRRREARLARLEERRTKAQGAVDRETGRRRYTDTQVNAQVRSNKMDLDAAMNAAQSLWEWHPDLAEQMYPDLVDNPLVLQRAIADELLGAKASGRMDQLPTVLQQLAEAESWSGPTPMVSSTKGAERLIRQGQREGAANMGSRLAERMRARAERARARGETAQAAAFDLMANLPTNRLKRVEKAAARLRTAEERLAKAQERVEAKAERAAAASPKLEANRAAYKAAVAEVESARRGLRSQVKYAAEHARNDLLDALGHQLPPHAGQWGGEWSRFEQALTPEGKAWLKNRNKELGQGQDMRRGNKAERAQSAGGMDELLERYGEHRGMESGGSGMASADAAEALAAEINRIAALEKGLREPLIARGGSKGLIEALGLDDELERYRPVDRGELNTPEEQAAVDRFNQEHGTAERDATLASPAGRPEGISARSAVALDAAHALIEKAGQEKALAWAERIDGTRTAASEAAIPEFIADAIAKVLDDGGKLPRVIQDALPKGAVEQWPQLEHIKAADEAMALADAEAQAQNANVTARSEDPNVQPLVAEQVAEQAARARGIEDAQARQEVVGGLIDQGMRAGERVGQAQGAAREADVAAGTAQRSAESAQAAAVRNHAASFSGGVGTLTGRHGTRMLGEGKTIARQRAALRELGIAERTYARLDELTQRQVDAAHAAFENAPSRYRPFLVANQKMVDYLTEMARNVQQVDGEAAHALMLATVDIPISLAHAVDANYNPAYAIGGDVNELFGDGTGKSTQGTLPAARKASDRYQRTAMKGPSSGAEAAQLAARRIAQWVRNETAFHIQARFAVTSPMILAKDAETAGIDPDLVDAWRFAADEETAQAAMVDLKEAASGRGYQVLTGDSGGVSFMPVHLRSGKALVQAMEDAGYVQWDPTGVFGRRPVAQVDDRAQFVPKAVWDSFYQQLGPASKTELALRKFYDKPMRYWKDSVLALSPRWNVNNIVGGVVTATAGGGINPGRYFPNFVRGMKILRTVGNDERLAKLMESDPEAAAVAMNLDPRNHQGSEAPAMREGDTLALEPETVGRVRQGGRLVGRTWRGVADAAYNWNGFVDDANRLAVFLSRKQTLTEAQLMGWLKRDPELGTVAAEAARRNKTTVHEELANEIAVRESLKVVGDFTRLTPLERRLARRVLPFYPWMRHITKLALRMPITSPVRVAWLMHLSLMFGEVPEFGFLQSYIPIGAEDENQTRDFLRIGKLNPFQDAMYGGTGSAEYAPRNIPANVLGNLTPAISAPMALATGLDMRKFQQLSRPPGSGSFDTYGNEIFNPLVGEGTLGIGAAASYLGNLTPQYRVAAAAKDGLDSLLGIHEWGGKLPLRYGNGQVMRSQGQDILSDRPWYGPAMDLLGVPLTGPERINLTGLRGKRDERARRAAAARARYAGTNTGSTQGVLPAWGASK